MTWRKTKKVVPHKPSCEEDSKSKKAWLADSNVEDRGCTGEQISVDLACMVTGDLKEACVIRFLNRNVWRSNW